MEELAALSEVAAAAASGNAAAALVVGDPGSGKSRLLAEAVARFRVTSVFRVVGYEPESDVPLAAASDLLRALAGAGRDGRRLDGLLLGDANEENSPLEPVRIFEAAHRALRAAGPALVVVDDLQWVDEALAGALPLSCAGGRRERAVTGVDRGGAPVSERRLTLRLALPLPGTRACS